MLQECGLNVNRAARELQAHGSIEFPCAGYASVYSEREEDTIPWHWHEEMEIIYIEEGQLNLKIPSNLFVLKEGDCAVINSNILHYGTAAERCSLRSLVFSPRLISGGESSVFSKKYMQPLVLCESFSGCLVSEEDRKETARCFRQAFGALQEELFGYEFTVRENLSHICLLLYKRFESEISEKAMGNHLNNQRMKSMLACIHKNFAEDLTLAEIARSADIGERECLRCFQKVIQLSPIQYLLKYRAMQGAEMLLNFPGKSISEIAALCGFDSPSNFAKIFKRFYKYTPRQYRKLKTIQK